MCGFFLSLDGGEMTAAMVARAKAEYLRRTGRTATTLFAPPALAEAARPLAEAAGLTLSTSGPKLPHAMGAGEDGVTAES